MNERCGRGRPGSRTVGSGASASTPGRLIAASAVAVAAAALVTGCGSSRPSASPGGSSASDIAKLPQATTFTTLKGVAQDAASATSGDAVVVHPAKPVTVSATPGGPAVAVLPATELGGPTWVPVVATRPGWDQVLLPSRPNHAAGWIAAGGLQAARSPYAVTVDRSARRLALLKSGHKLGTWTVAVGAAKTPTPAGRTFVLALLAPTKATYSPLILPLGTHSQTLDTFGGGPGTVAFHGWPQKSVFGKAITNGCVRVPADALTQLSKIPLGTPVTIT